MNRHARQARLADIGAAGQARIASARVAVAGESLASLVEARYLAGAGVAGLRVRAGALAAASRRVDPAVTVEVDGSLGERAPDDGFDLRDPAARAVASGAREALRTLRALLDASPRPSGEHS